ncbi:MAG: GNAT family N-acetyltransferase [Bifidobacteriaceae bacterium]|jgi:ribosomal protein S18 acetylase RimI-like enzyme|nr:GNAT family N-acetyltransferase [Bifidobacteriaceae bacterium]
MSEPIETSKKKISIEHAQPEDLAAMEKICELTVDQGIEPKPSRNFLQFVPAIWLTPYMTLGTAASGIASDATSGTTPDTRTICLVARLREKGSAESSVIGYCISALNAHEFETSVAQNWYPQLRAQYQSRVGEFTASDKGTWRIIAHPEPVEEAWLGKYPAETHINILANGRGLGVGRHLLETMSTELRVAGIPGFYLGTAPLNVKAHRFYEHMGYELIAQEEGGGPVYGVVLGLSGLSAGR